VGTISHRDLSSQWIKVHCIFFTERKRPIQTGNWSPEDDSGSAVCLAGDCSGKALRPAVELVMSGCRPIGRVIVTDATQLTHRGADHDVSTIHPVHVTDRIYNTPQCVDRSITSIIIAYVRSYF